MRNEYRYYRVMDLVLKALLLNLIILAVTLGVVIVQTEKEIGVLSKVQEQTETIQGEIEVLQVDVEETLTIPFERLCASDRNLIERVVAGEARGESKEGMIAVAQTIKDRGDLWGMSYREVCLQKDQFYTGYNGEISYDVEEAVSLVFDFGVRATEGFTTHFYGYNLIDEPYWAKSKELVATIGGHRFYY